MVIWPFYASLDVVDSLPSIVEGETPRMSGLIGIFADERLLKWDMKFFLSTN